MLPTQVATETVVRLRGVTSTDTHANTTTNWSSPDPLSISRCSVQPVQGSEDLLSRDAVVSRWQWFGPEDADVKSSDRIKHRGVDYEVDGSVQEWVDPLGLWSHKVCYLRRVEG